MAEDDLLQPDDEPASEDEAEHLAEDAARDDVSTLDREDEEGPRAGEPGLTPPD